MDIVGCVAAFAVVLGVLIAARIFVHVRLLEIRRIRQRRQNNSLRARRPRSHFRQLPTLVITPAEDFAGLVETFESQSQQSRTMSAEPVRYRIKLRKMDALDEEASLTE